MVCSWQVSQTTLRSTPATVPVFAHPTTPCPTADASESALHTSRSQATSRGGGDGILPGSSRLCLSWLPLSPQRWLADGQTNESSKMLCLPRRSPPPPARVIGLPRITPSLIPPSLSYCAPLYEPHFGW